MTTANGGTQAGQYPCDDWVDRLKPTLLITLFVFGFSDTVRTQPLMSYLQDKKLVISYRKQIYSYFIIDLRQYKVVKIKLGDRRWQSTCNILSFSRYDVHFYTTMQYSKAIMKHRFNCLFFVVSGFGERVLGCVRFISSPRIKKINN